MTRVIRPILRNVRTLLYRGRRSPAARRWRPDWLPFWIPTDVESRLHPHVPEERGELFLATATATTEVEVLNWLYATVCLLKPSSILETGAAQGVGTLALASACRANGFGMVHSIEIDPAQCAAAESLVRRYGLADHATFHAEDSRTFLRRTTLSFGLGWFDSVCELRAEEFEICLDRGILSGPAAFHDTSPHRTQTLRDWPDPESHAAYRRQLQRLAEDSRVTGAFESTLSRGLFLIFPRRSG